MKNLNRLTALTLTARLLHPPARQRLPMPPPPTC